MKLLNSKVYFILKIVIVIFALTYLYLKLSESIANSDGLSTIDWVKIDWMLVIYAILLMPINWLIESFKWKILVKKFQAFTFTKAIMSVLTGTFFSMFTPNRIGDGAGRMLHLEPGMKTKAGFAFILSSSSQLLITLFWGCVSLALIPTFLNDSDVTWFSTASWIQWLVYPLFILAFLLYIEPGWIILIKNKFKKESFIGKRIEMLEFYSRSKKWIILGLSALRFAIFTLQFCLVLYAFQFPITHLENTLRIGLVFLSSAIVPTFALAEIGVRESFALLYFDGIVNNAMVIFSATLIVWIINLLIPSIIGLFIFLKHKKR